MSFETLRGIMLIGYARVSTEEQSLDLQTDALKAAGCGRVFSEKASGASVERKALTELLHFIREGDTLVVYKLDRLGRSLPHLLETVSSLEARGVGFKSITEGIDTSTPGGRLVFHIFGSLAEFERDLIKERTTAGLEAARVRGRVGGRPQAMTSEQVKQARALAVANIPIGNICKTLGISRSTYYRHLD
jgi:DNA invertase Pin-like site-specific DNA recombinase